MAIEFSSSLVQAEGMTATGIPVPDAVVSELGPTKNPPVAVRVRKSGTGDDWYRYRISIGNRDGRYLLSFSSANRTASGLVAGDTLDVEVEIDTAPREIEVPDDLATALTRVGGLDRFLALSYSKKRAHVEPIVAAKAEDTRQRRIDKVVAEFSE
jgi:hypothetical protein